MIACARSIVGNASTARFLLSLIRCNSTSITALSNHSSLRITSCIQSCCKTAYNCFSSDTAALCCTSFGSLGSEIKASSCAPALISACICLIRSSRLPRRSKRSCRPVKAFLRSFLNSPIGTKTSAPRSTSRLPHSNGVSPVWDNTLTTSSLATARFTAFSAIIPVTANISFSYSHCRRIGSPATIRICPFIASFGVLSTKSCRISSNNT